MFYLSKNPENGIIVSIKILSSTTVATLIIRIVDNNEGSCDTEDWSNDA